MNILAFQNARKAKKINNLVPDRGEGGVPPISEAAKLGKLAILALEPAP
jgi:hypothetical protein